MENKSEEIDLNNCYCEGTEEHYDRLENYGFQPSRGFAYHVIEGKLAWGHDELIEDRKQIHLVNNQWEYVMSNEEKVQDFHRELMENVLSIKDGDVEYLFEKPDFECELLKVVNSRIIGYIKPNKCTTTIYPMSWFFKTGDIIIQYSDQMKFKDSNLTPIKLETPWYEDEGNFPVIMIDEKSFDEPLDCVCRSKEIYEDMCKFNKNWRLLTNEEIDQLKVNKKD